jgi:hypothetical protein
VGDTITEADVRLFTTLARFDAVYHNHFKCNRSKLTEMPVLWAYARDLFQTPGFGDTIDFDHIKRHYYEVHTDINPSGIVPAGPDLSGWATPTAARSSAGDPSATAPRPGRHPSRRAAIVEIKSLTSAHGGVAGLSSTPSTRGVRHLEALADLAGTGTPTAVAFVVQRGDVTSLDLTAPAAPSWVEAVERARQAGVHVVAFGCEVGTSRLRLGPPLPVHPDQPPARPPRARAQATSTTTTAR